jgi:hypothetical protein
MTKCPQKSYPKNVLGGQNYAELSSLQLGSLVTSLSLMVIKRQLNVTLTIEFFDVASPIVDTVGQLVMMK